MLRRLSILLTAGALVLAVGGATALAGDKAGAVNVTTVCEDLQDNIITQGEELYVYLHTPNADGWPWEITYHQDGTDSGTLDLVESCFDGWYLYDTGTTASALGAASLQVWDFNGKNVGGDSFLVIGGQ